MRELSLGVVFFYSCSQFFSFPGERVPHDPLTVFGPPTQFFLFLTSTRRVPSPLPLFSAFFPLNVTCMKNDELGFGSLQPFPRVAFSRSLSFHHFVFSSPFSRCLFGHPSSLPPLLGQPLDIHARGCLPTDASGYSFSSGPFTWTPFPLRGVSCTR